MRRYRISVLTLQGHSLTFHVSKYEITDGDFVDFFDERTKKQKRFHASRCEITVIEEEGNLK